MERLNNVCTRILQLVYLNALWLAFTLLGLGVAGIGPATFALFGVVRQWIRGNTDIPVFSTFWTLYRSHFKEAAIVGFLYGAAGLVLYVDLLFVQSLPLRIILCAAGFIYIVSAVYIFPIMVHYEVKGIGLKIKHSVLLGISYLQYTLILLIGAGIALVLLLLKPGFTMIFAVSAMAYVVMWQTHQVFKRAEADRSAHKQEPSFYYKKQNEGMN